MAFRFPKVANEQEAENFFGIREGAIAYTTHYAREGALLHIMHLRDMEARHAGRPALYYLVLSDLDGSTVASAKLDQDLNMPTHRVIDPDVS